MNTILLAGMGLTLAACAECPKTADYTKPPYVREGTAGQGVAVYNSRCAVVEERKEEVVTRPAPEPYTPPSAPRAETVFRESQKK